MYIHVYIYIYTYTYIYIYIYMCVCVCVCVWQAKPERGAPAGRRPRWRRHNNRRGGTAGPPLRRGSHSAKPHRGPGRGSKAPGDCALAQVNPGPTPTRRGDGGRGARLPRQRCDEVAAFCRRRPLACLRSAARCHKQRTHLKPKGTALRQKNQSSMKPIQN